MRKYVVCVCLVFYTLDWIVVWNMYYGLKTFYVQMWYTHLKQKYIYVVKFQTC